MYAYVYVYICTHIYVCAYVDIFSSSFIMVHMTVKHSSHPLPTYETNDTQYSAVFSCINTKATTSAWMYAIRLKNQLVNFCVADPRKNHLGAGRFRAKIPKLYFQIHAKVTSLWWRTWPENKRFCWPYDNIYCVPVVS